MMERLAKFIVRHRKGIAAIFVIAAAICAVLTVNVNVNEDETRYLPETMMTRQGLDAMNEAFAETTTINLMVKDIPEDEKMNFKTDLEKFSLVSSVLYEEDSDFYNKDEYTLYEITVFGNSYSQTAQDGMETCEQAAESRGYEYWVAADIGNEAAQLLPIMILSVILAMIILFILATSWIEPILVLSTILIAVLLNMGTNIVFPYISDTSFSIASILQMALSMDYLIMLMNRYRVEREKYLPEQAMERALVGGVTAIASSSITTIVGLLCLVFMSFAIGADLGLVLAKGIAFSLLCVFGVQPALAIATDRLLVTTAKPHPHPEMRGLARFSYKMRLPITLFFVALFVVGLLGRTSVDVDYYAANNTPDTPTVREIFPAHETIVVAYKEKYTEAAAELEERVLAYDGTQQMLSANTSTDKEYTAAQMANTMEMPEALVSMLYYHYYHDGDTGSISSSAFVNYLNGGIQEDLGDMLSPTITSSIESVAELITTNVSPGTYTAQGLADAINMHSVSADDLGILYLAYQATHNTDPEWTMTPNSLTEFLIDEVVDDQVFATFFDASTRKELEEARDQIVAGRSEFIANGLGRIIIQVPYETQCDEMYAYTEQLYADCEELFGCEGGDENGWYVVGTGPMAKETEEGFSYEFNYISILTIISIFIIVLVTFRSLAIPVLLVCLIQSAYCWDMIVNLAMGHSLYYFALIVVQCILMGATIDYAILYTTNYRSARKTMSVKDAVAFSYKHSIRTIMMSASILVVVTGAIGFGLNNGGITASISMVISIGSLLASLFVLFILPGAMAFFDKLIVPKKNRFENQAPLVESEQV